MKLKNYLILIVLFLYQSSFLIAQEKQPYRLIDTMRAEGIKPSERDRITYPKIELLSFIGYREHIQYGESVDLRIKFYMPLDTTLYITARDIITEENPNELYYRMRPMNIHWKRGWQEFGPWPTKGIIEKVNLRVDHIGVIGNLISNYSIYIVPLNLFYHTLPETISKYTLIFKPNITFSRVTYEIFKRTELLSIHKSIGKGSISTIEAGVPFSIRIDLTGNENGVYDLVINCYRKQDNDNDRRLTTNYSFYHMSSLDQEKDISSKLTETVKTNEIIEKGKSLPDLIRDLLEKTRTWAVVVGINNYSNSNNGYKALPYSVSDAEHIKSSLIANMGLSEDRIFTLYNSEATKKNIEFLLGDKLPNLLTSHDRLLFYFSGHGETHSTEYKDHGYLIPIDGKKESLYSSCISMNQLSDFSDLIPAKQVLFIIDACYSGIAGIINKGGEELTKEIKKVTEAQVRIFMESRGRQIMTAGSSKETAIMGEKWQNHSVYTYYLLRGLKGEADTNGDNIISTYELQAYLSQNVSNDTSGKQNPQLYFLNVSEGQFVFYREGEF